MKFNTIITPLVCLVILSTQTSIAKTNLPAWQDPKVFQENKQPARASFYSYNNQADVNIDQPWHADNYQSLNGTWKFNWVEHPSKREENFYQLNFNDKKWDNFSVPANWQMNEQGKRYGVAQYINHPCHTPKLAPPNTPDKVNPVGSYRRWFDVPKNWGDQQIFVHFGGVNSAFYIWINGKKVGYSEDSKTPAEFDISPYITSGKNLIALEVYRYSDATYFECQDMWRMSGIERDVYVYATPKTRIEDFSADATLADNYVDGIFNFSAKIENHQESYIQNYQLKVELLDDNNKVVLNQRLAIDSIGSKLGNNQTEVKLNLPVVAPKQWSAETPNLYDLNLTLVNDKGTAIEYVQNKIGFRRSELKNGLILINGKPVKFKGVNRHDHHPVSGHVIPRESMLKDVQMMKRANINAIRTSHYPNDTYLYQLADKYGLYVMDEANIESHGLGAANQAAYSPKAHIVNKQDWLGAYLYRANNMYQRDKNHASVVILSPGNETGDGANTEAVYDWLKAQSTRPVIFEQAQQRRHTDAYAQMYASIADVEYYVKNTYSTDKRPLVLIEYEHMMGNSGGNLKDYWDLFESHEELQGGFIWDWVDQTWALKDKQGNDYWGYGGDIEPEGMRNDKSFSANGLVYADRTPYPYYYEVKSVYQNMGFYGVNVEKGSFVIRNKQYFADLSAYKLVWQVVENGEVVDQGQLNNLTVEAQQEKQFQLAYSFKRKANAEYFLNLSLQTKQEKGMLPKGFEAATAQLAFAKQPVITPSLAQTTKSKHQPLKLMQSSKAITISGKGFRYKIDKKKGLLTQIDYAGNNLLKAPAKPNFWRAPTDNDFGEKFTKKSAIWRTVSDQLELKSLKVSSTATQVIVKVGHYLPKVESKQFTTYTFDASGELKVDNQFYAAEHKKLPALPRIGMLFELDKTFEQVNWYGRGPMENYWDRKTAADVGLYQSTVDDLYVPYVRPQENGYRSDVRRVAFSNKKGQGIEFVADYLLGFGAERYSIDEYAFEKGVNQHPNELKASDSLYIKIDHRQRGVAGTDSWRSSPLYQYTIPWRDYQYSFRLRPYNQ